MSLFKIVIVECLLFLFYKYDNKFKNLIIYCGGLKVGKVEEKKTNYILDKLKFANDGDSVNN